MLMHKILQNHLLCAFVANLKIDAIYAHNPESFCGKNLAIWKVFAFCDSETTVRISSVLLHLQYYFDGADEGSEVCDINHNAGVCNCDMR